MNISISLVSGVWFTNLASAEAVGLSVPPVPMVIVCPSYKHKLPYEVKIAPTVNPRLDKICLMPTKEMVPLIYLNAQSVYINQKILKNLRAGGFSTHFTLIVIGGVVFMMCQLSGIDAFTIFTQMGQSNSPKTDQPFVTQPGSTVGVIRPSAVPHQEFVSLSKGQRRQLPHPNDMKINHEGYPELEVGFWQSQYKVRDHGAIHGLPYTLNKNGGTKTEKTNQNTLEMMKSVVDMQNRDHVQWFVNGTYQGGTDREFPAIHIYDLENQIIAVFKKSTGKFVTTCQLDPEEDAELKATANFGGGKDWFSRRVRNLPPIQYGETPVNTFSPIDENSSPNLGFTPMSSFESDVMEITPIDNSEVDNP